MNNDLKKYQTDKQTIISIVKYAIIAVIVAAVLFFGFQVVLLLLPVMIGFIIAHASVVISSSIYKLIRRKKPRSIEEGGDTRSYRAFKLIVFTLMLLGFLAFVILVIIALIAQIRNLIRFLETNDISLEFITNISAYLREMSEKLGGFLPEAAITRITEDLAKLQEDILDLIPDLTHTLLTSLLGFISNFPDIIFKAIVIIMAGYYYISDRIIIGKFMNTLFPSPVFVHKVSGAVTKVASSLFRVIGGYMIIMMVTFTEALIGLLILDIPYAVIFAIAAMFIDLLPMVGASACFLPISIYMFVNGNVLGGIFALFMVGLMTMVRTFMDPKVVGTAMKLHPLATLVAMLLGVHYLGVIGFLGGPIIVVFIIGLSDAFGFQKTFRDMTGKILNKVSRAGSPPPDAQVKRLKHIVMWRLSDNPYGLSKEDAAREMSEKLLSLPSQIPQILSFTVSTDIKCDKTAFDIILVSEFDSPASLDIYKNHPAHVEVAKWIHGAIIDRAVIDT